MKKIIKITTIAMSIILIATTFTVSGFATTPLTDKNINEQKPMMRFVFDDDTIHKVSENEFQSILESNSTEYNNPASRYTMNISENESGEVEQPMIYFYLYNDDVYKLSKSQFDEVMENYNIDEIIIRDKLKSSEKSENKKVPTYSSIENTILSSTRTAGSWSIDNNINSGVRMDYFMPGGGSFVVNSGERIVFSIEPDQACWLTLGVYGTKNYSTGSYYVDMSSNYGMTIGTYTPGSYKFYAINDNNFNIWVTGGVDIS